MSVTEHSEAAVNVLTGDDVAGYLDGQTRKYLGMSLDAFCEAAERGELPDHPMVPHLVLLSGAEPTGC